MNERIKQLAEQAGLLPLWVCVNESTGSQMIKPIDQEIIERFAELVRQDLYQEIGKSVITQIQAATKMEREACAKLCESEGHRIDASWKSCAAAIRGRTE